MKIRFLIISIVLFILTITQTNSTTANISYLPYGFQCIQDTGGITNHLTITYRIQGNFVYCDVIKKDDGFDWTNYTDFPITVYKDNGYYRYPYEDEIWVSQWEQIYYFQVDLSKKDAYTFKVPKWFDPENYRIKLGYETVTYNGGTDTIIVTDGTASAPITIDDIYQADVAGGWGQVTRQGGAQYDIDANLQIGNASNTSYFYAHDCSIELDGTLVVNSGSTAHFGDWYQDHSINGTYVWFTKEYTVTTYCNIYGTLLIYGSLFRHKNQTGSTTKRLYIRAQVGATTDYRESTFSHFRGLLFYNNDTYCEDVLIRNVQTGFYLFLPPDTPWTRSIAPEFSPPDPHPGTISVWNGSADTTRVSMWDISVVRARVLPNNALAVLELILVNPMTEPTTIVIDNIANDNCKLILNYTFDLMVTNVDGTPISGADVTVINTSGVEIVNVTTAADGTIPQQQLTRLEYYGATETQRDCDPYNITINATGNLTYTNTFNITSPINWTIALQNGTGGGGTTTIYTDIDVIRSQLQWHMILPMSLLFSLLYIMVYNIIHRKKRKRKW